MRILKKSLACLLVAIIAATAMFGCLVSADTVTSYEGTMYIYGDVSTIDVGSTDAVNFTVGINNGDAENPVAALVTIASELGKVTAVSVADHDGAIFTGEYLDVKIDENGVATVLIESSSLSEGYAWSYAVLDVTVAPNADLALGDYETTVSAVSETVGGATYDEIPIVYSSDSVTVSVVEPLGSASNPYVLNGNRFPPMKATYVTIAAGETIYVRAYGFAGYEVGADFDCEISVETLTTAEELFTVTNNSGVDIVDGLVKVLDPIGAKENPEIITAGDHTATVVEGSQGYYYAYTATADGTVTVTMPAGDWTYVINNLTAGTYGDTQWSDSDPVVNPGTVAVAKDDVLEIMVNTYDPASPWTAPAGEINWNLTLEEAVTEPEVDENITTTPSINITQTINLRYLFANIPACDDFYAVVSHDRCDSSYNFIEGGYTVTIEKSDMNSTADGRYYFLYNQMRLFELNIPITVTLYCLDANDNVIYTSVPSVTKVADQAKASFASSGNANAKTLYSDIIELGSVAQTYFVNGKDVDLADVALPNVGFEGTPSGDIDVSKLDTTYVPNTTAVSLTPSFNLSGNPAVRFLVDGVSEYDLANLKMVISYTSPKYTITDTVLGFDELQVSGTRYYTLYSGIALPDGNQPVTCKIYNGEIAEENIIAETVYSVEYAIANTNSTSRAYDLYMHVAKLGAAARVYFKY